MARQYKPSRRRGLTAVEWAIAVVILGILAIILVPVLTKAREPVRKPSCQGNLKELAAALSMYCEDCGGQLPSAVGATDDISFETQYKKTKLYARATTWAGAVRGFVQHSDAYYCPSDPKAHGSTTSYHYKHAAHIAAKSGFGKDWFLRPSRQIILYERGDFHRGVGTMTEGARVNVAFVDGHVRYLRMVDVAPDKEPRYFNAVDRSKPGASEMKMPYWDPRYCYDKPR